MSFKRRHGAFAGISGQYAEFRYGANVKRPVHVPGKPKPSRHLVTGSRRQQIVAQVKEMLDAWHLSKFEFEAPCRHGLRAGFCLEGHSWARSDIEAERLVAEGLQAINAQRPDWEEGQRQFTESPDRCAWCSGPLDDERRTRGQRYCCRDCAASALVHFDRKSNRYAGEFIRSAQRLVAREDSAPRNCAHCGATFKSDRADAVFCSPRCVSRHQKGDALLTSRACPECQVLFHPQNRDQVHCSHACDGRARARQVRESLQYETRTCQCCGDGFTPTTPENVYCSPRCASTMANRAYRKRQGKAGHVCTCRLCAMPSFPRCHGQAIAAPTTRKSQRVSSASARRSPSQSRQLRLI